MAKLLLPMYALDTLVSVTATPTTYGSIVATHELRVAMDTDPMNSTYLWTGSDQPVVWRYTDISDIDFTFFGTPTFATYCRIENNAFNALSGDYNYAVYQSSAAGSVWDTQTIAGYGDGSLNAIDKFWEFDTSLHNASTPGKFLITTAQNSHDYQRLLLGTQNANIGANYSVFDLMHGILINLPDISDERSESEAWYGGAVEYNPVGHVNWRGLRGAISGLPAGRMTTTKIFGEITTTWRDILFAAFFYSRSIYPCLWVEDTSDVRTWRIVRLAGMTEREPQGNLHFVEWQLEEF